MGLSNIDYITIADYPKRSQIMLQHSVKGMQKKREIIKKKKSEKEIIWEFLSIQMYGFIYQQ